MYECLSILIKLISCLQRIKNIRGGFIRHGLLKNKTVYL